MREEKIVMASNFWTSSHWESLTTRGRLKEAHAQDRELGLSEDVIQRMKIHVLEYVSDLAKISQQLIRQRVVATAMTYFRRFYVLHDFCRYDPRHVGIACLYLACKSEEAQVQVKVLFQIMNKLSARRPTWPPIEMSQLLDLEMALLEELDYNLVVFSPYRDLLACLKDPRIADLAEFAWAALNDSYRTEICLLYPPYIIALAAINMAAAAAKHNLQPWLEELNIDFGKLADATRELMFCYRQYNDCMPTEEFNRYLEVVSKPP